MAGIDHSIITQGPGYKSAAVAAVLFLLLLVFLPGAARCDYRITAADREVLTRAYWVAGDKVYLFEDTAPIELTEVSSIQKESLSPLEIELYQDALSRFFVYSSWLATKEDEMRFSQGEILEAMKAIDELRAQRHERSEIKKAVGVLSERLETLEEQVSLLKELWSRARIPEHELVMARDIKYLQLLSLRSSIRQCRRYLETRDPTCREYALELYGQISRFDGSFYDALIRPIQR